ncbi:MAG: hypothetical protein SCALA702_11280 [Melioribacteraceae bacterium]|nr:MAG: hypothetical protein SCALA702_11280 [Melioribacteraceae bacterium]
MPEEFKSLSDILAKSPAFKGVRDVVDENRVIDDFYEIFPDLKKVAAPVKIDKKGLHIKVDNSVWRNELNLRQRIIIEKINKYFDKEVVKTIKFVSR